MELFTEEAEFNIMVMELLGPNIETLFAQFDRRFTPKTVLMLAEQTVCIMEIEL